MDKETAQEGRSLRKENRREAEKTVSWRQSDILPAGSVTEISISSSCSRECYMQSDHKRTASNSSRAPLTHSRNPSSSSQNGDYMMEEPELQGIHRLSPDEIGYRVREGPKMIKHYFLGEVLGEGSYGKVREALDSRTLEYVAIKIMKKRSIRKIPGGEESVKREIEIMALLRHPNCVRMRDFFEDEEKGKLYLVIDFVGGGSLTSLVERSPSKKLPLCQVRFLFKQLIDALEYIHGMGITHRDVKPDNMLLDPSFCLKLSDFGIAQLEGKATAKGNGTPAFQAPELASGKDTGSSGAKADIWAAGVTLYFMCSGRYPFEENTNVFTLFETITKGEYEMPDFIEPVLADLVRGIMNVDYEKRFSIQQIREHPWMSATLQEENFVPTAPFVSSLSSVREQLLRQHAKPAICRCAIV